MGGRYKAVTMVEAVLRLADAREEDGEMPGGFQSSTWSTALSGGGRSNSAPPVRYLTSVATAVATSALDGAMHRPYHYAP